MPYDPSQDPFWQTQNFKDEPEPKTPPVGAGTLPSSVMLPMLAKWLEDQAKQPIPRGANGLQNPSWRGGNPPFDMSGAKVPATGPLSFTDQDPNREMPTPNQMIPRGPAIPFEMGPAAGGALTPPATPTPVGGFVGAPGVGVETGAAPIGFMPRERLGQRLEEHLRMSEKPYDIAGAMRATWMELPEEHQNVWEASAKKLGFESFHDALDTSSGSQRLFNEVANDLRTAKKDRPAVWKGVPEPDNAGVMERLHKNDLMIPLVKGAATMAISSLLAPAAVAALGPAAGATAVLAGRAKNLATVAEAGGLTTASVAPEVLTAQAAIKAAEAAAKNYPRIAQALESSPRIAELVNKAAPVARAAAAATPELQGRALTSAALPIAAWGTERITGGSEAEGNTAAMESIPGAIANVANYPIREGLLKLISARFGGKIPPAVQTALSTMLGAGAGAATGYAAGGTAGAVAGGLGEGVAGAMAAETPVIPGKKQPEVGVLYNHLTGDTLPPVAENLPLNPLNSPMSEERTGYLEALKNALVDPAQRGEIEPELTRLYNQTIGGLRGLQEGASTGAMSWPRKATSGESVNAITEDAQAMANELARTQGPDVQIRRAGMGMPPTQGEIVMMSSGAETMAKKMAGEEIDKLVDQFYVPGASPQEAARAAQDTVKVRLDNKFKVSSNKFEEARSRVQAAGLHGVPGIIAETDMAPARKKLADISARFESNLTTPEDPMVKQIRRLESLVEGPKTGGPSGPITFDERGNVIGTGTGTESPYTIGELIDDRAGLARQRNDMPYGSAKRKMANRTLEVMDDLIKSSVTTAGADPAIVQTYEKARGLHKYAIELEEMAQPITDGYSLNVGRDMLADEGLEQQNKVQEALDKLVENKVAYEVEPRLKEEIALNQAVEAYKADPRAENLEKVSRSVANNPRIPEKSKKAFATAMSQIKAVPDDTGSAFIRGLLPDMRNMSPEQVVAAKVKSAQMTGVLNKLDPGQKEITRKLMVKELAVRNSDPYIIIDPKTGSKMRTEQVINVAAMLQDARMNPNVNPLILETLESISKGNAETRGNIGTYTQLAKEARDSHSLNQLVDGMVFDKDERYVKKLAFLKNVLDMGAEKRNTSSNDVVAAVFTKLMKDQSGKVDYNGFAERLAQMSPVAKAGVFGPVAVKAEAAAAILKLYSPLMALLETARESRSGVSQIRNFNVVHGMADKAIPVPGMLGRAASYLPVWGRGMEYLNKRLLSSPSAKTFVRELAAAYGTTEEVIRDYAKRLEAPEEGTRPEVQR